MQIGENESIILPGKPCQNEREALEPFISHFNSVENTCYEAVTWFDEERIKEHTPSQKPEVLLKDAYGCVMVIERKSITLPEERSRQIGNFEVLCKTLWRKLSESFQSDLYVLTLLGEDLVQVEGYRRSVIVEAILKSVLTRQETIARGNVVGGKKPIHWKFERAPEHIREDYPSGKTGILMCRAGGEISSELSEVYRELEKIREKIVASPKNYYKQSRDKMQNYNGLKVLVLEFYGDGSDYLIDEDIVEVLKSAGNPAGIDQVWLTVKDLISGQNTWRRLF